MRIKGHVIFGDANKPSDVSKWIARREYDSEMIRLVFYCDLFLENE